MDKTLFNKLIIKVYMYYQSMKMPSQSQIDLWFDQISHIPNEAIEFIEKEIYRDRDSLPRNIPKAIKESYDNYPKTMQFFKYDQTEDLRFPVAKMIEGLGVLQSKGRAAFDNFARFVHMPLNDQDRVKVKAAIISGEKHFDIAEIKGKIGGWLQKGDANVQERIGLLKHQAETILREPGEEIDDLPF